MALNFLSLQLLKRELNTHLINNQVIHNIPLLFHTNLQVSTKVNNHMESWELFRRTFGRA